nr:MAG TPA: hypothetical protein [Caudoviricetes sp.]
MHIVPISQHYPECLLTYSPSCPSCLPLGLTAT